MTARAHDLAIKKTRQNGYHDIELISMSAVKISRVSFRFDGRKYESYRSSLKPID